jgi:hypothetical protein
MVMEELADQEISLASVQMEDTSRLTTQKMKVINNHVSGTITDGKGNPLPGVTVILSGSTIGGVSDGNGHFSLELPASEGVLAFSFVGMKPLEVRYNGQSELKIKLEEEVAEMDEVVIT